MKLRLMGLPAEVDAAVGMLRDVFDVHEVSGPYACRGDSQLARVYLECVVGRRRLTPDAARQAAWEVAMAAAANAGMEFACGCGREDSHLPTGDCKIVLQPKAATR